MRSGRVWQSILTNDQPHQARADAPLKKEENLQVTPPVRKYGSKPTILLKVVTDGIDRH